MNYVHMRVIYVDIYHNYDGMQHKYLIMHNR